MRCILIAATAAALAGVAQAGVVIRMEERGQVPGHAVETRHQQLWIDSGKFRSTGLDGGVIYRGDLNRGWMYNDRRKTIVEVQPVAGVPATAPPAPSVRYERTGQMARIGRWSCERFSRFERGKKTAELCVAKLTELGLTLADFEPQKRFLSLMQSAIGDEWWAVDKLDLEVLSRAIGYPGMPIHGIEYLPKQRQLETTVTAIERKPVEASLFELPKGYAKEQVPLRSRP